MVPTQSRVKRAFANHTFDVPSRLSRSSSIDERYELEDKVRTPHYMSRSSESGFFPIHLQLQQPRHLGFGVLLILLVD